LHSLINIGNNVKCFYSDHRHPQRAKRNVRKPHPRLRCVIKSAASGDVVSEGIHRHGGRKGKLPTLLWSFASFDDFSITIAIHDMTFHFAMLLDVAAGS
jgi:hypothetical protein